MAETPKNTAMTVLLIEDNPGDVRLVQAILAETTKDLGIKLLVAEDLTHGLKYIAAESIHAILLDLNLPESHGIETFRKISKFAINIPIIIMSIVSDKELIYQAMREGAQDYLIKGEIENEALVRGIRYAIWSRRAA